MLCHFVLRYRAGGAGDVAALANRVRSDGRLSVMDVNRDGRVLRELLNGGPAAARAELRAERAAVQTFQTEARKVSADAGAVQPGRVRLAAGLRTLTASGATRFPFRRPSGS